LGSHDHCTMERARNSSLPVRTARSLFTLSGASALAGRSEDCHARRPRERTRTECTAMVPDMRRAQRPACSSTLARSWAMLGTASHVLLMSLANRIRRFLPPSETAPTSGRRACREVVIGRADVTNIEAGGSDRGVPSRAPATSLILSSCPEPCYSYTLLRPDG